MELPPEIKSGSLYRLIDRMSRQLTGGQVCALFLNADGMTLWLTEYVLAELLAQQLIIAAAANNPPYA